MYLSAFFLSHILLVISGIHHIQYALLYEAVNCRRISFIRSALHTIHLLEVV